MFARGLEQLFPAASTLYLPRVHSSILA